MVKKRVSYPKGEIAWFGDVVSNHSKIVIEGYEMTMLERIIQWAKHKKPRRRPTGGKR